MPDKCRVHAAIAIEVFFEREDDQRFVDVVAQQADAPLAPRPELRGDVIDGGNAALRFICRATRQLNAGESITMARSGLRRSASRISCWYSPRIFGRWLRISVMPTTAKIFGVDDCFAARRAHAISAHAKEFQGTILCGDRPPGAARVRSASCNASISCAPYISPEASPAEIRIRKEHCSNEHGWDTKSERRRAPVVALAGAQLEVLE